MLLGRGRQVEEIGQLLSDARARHGRGLLVSGEPGIGKTALLACARELASDAGMDVIQAVGVQAEAKLPFAALGEVAGPLLDRLGELPDRQAAAIEAALAMGESSGTFHDPLAVCVGFLGLLRAAAERRPLLVLVDDAHWLDEPSAECVGYAARRLGGTAVALLAAARPVVDRPPLDGRLTDELTLGGLPEGDARELLLRRAGDVAPTTTQALLEAAAGNPLALIELPTLLSDEQRRGAAPFEPALARGGALWLAFERQVAAQGEEVDLAMLAAAASIDRELRTVLAACDDLGVGKAALERAEAAGLVELDHQRLSFAHPLLRAVVYHGAPAAERRRVNAVLARHAAPDAAAWHAAAAALGPDDAVADALEAAADRAVARGAYSTATDALERASALSEDPDAAAIRQCAAGLAAAMGGQYVRSAALLESVAGVDDPLMRATVRHLLAMARLVGGFGNALENHAMLVEQAEQVTGIDDALAATLYADAGVCATVAGDCRLALEAGERAAAVLPADAQGPTRCQVHAMLGMGLAMAGRTAEARVALDRAGELLGEVDPLSPAAQPISFALDARLCTGQDDLLFREAQAMAKAAAAGGSAGLLPYYELLTADSAFRLGDWEVAEREAEAAVAIADHSGQRGPLSIALVVQSRIAAARGQDDGAAAGLARAVEIARPPGYGSTVIWAHAATGFLYLARGRASEAIAELEECGRLSRIAGLEDPTIVPWAPDLVEAYVVAGRAEPAQRVCDELERRAERSGVPLALALSARCRGLTAPDGFDDHFARALDHHERCTAPLDRARTLLAYGSRLHRARRRMEAREQLRQALAEFERLGAVPWAERARAELRAAGGVERRPRGSDDELTAQEARIAACVARGSTNREVAEELFLSPKTVEFHLGRVFRKLGIRSRTELAVLVAEGEAGLAPDPADRLERSF